MSRNRSVEKADHQLHRDHNSQPQLLFRSLSTEDFLPLTLHHVSEDCLPCMQPADVIPIEESDTLRYSVDTVFFAVLACPKCGTLNLITAPQYFGAIPVICSSNSCSCRFRIDDQNHLVYLPVN